MFSHFFEAAACPWSFELFSVFFFGDFLVLLKSLSSVC